MPLEGMEELQNVGKEEKTALKVEETVEDKEEKIIEDLVEPGDENEYETSKDKKIDEPLNEDYLPRPSLKAINEKYPNLFKDFPQLRDMYFREDKLTQVFPTVEDAQAAKSDLEGFQALESAIKTGKIEDTEMVLSSIKELDSDTLPNFAINVLPALQKIDQNAYFTAITPVLRDAIREIYQGGVKNGNENLKNAALAASLYLFGNKDIASGQSDIKTPAPKIKESENKDNKERNTILQERYELFRGDVSDEYVSTLKNDILKGLDPDEVMSDFMKDALVQSIINRIDKVLGADNSHKSNMSRLWKQAESSRFSRDWKDRILNAALSRAKSIMPTIRMRARNEALKTKESQGNKMEEKGKNDKTYLPNNGVFKSEKVSSFKNVDANKVDWKKTSDLDFLQGNIKLKS